MVVVAGKGIHTSHNLCLTMPLMMPANSAFHELSACAALPATGWALTRNKQRVAYVLVQGSFCLQQLTLC